MDTMIRAGISSDGPRLHQHRGLHQRRTHRAGIRRRIGVVLAALVAVASVATTAVRPDGTALAAPVQIDIVQPGPLGAVTVIGDSVLLGSALVGPTLADRLAERGWGPIRMRAGEGYSSGKFGVQQSFRSTYWLGLWRSQGWDAPNVIVNLGANDSGFCKTDITCAREAIMHVVDDIGPGHTIWWPQITRFFTHFGEQDNWNQALLQIAAERDDFHTWDWPSELPLYNSADGTHLDGAGYRTRSARMAEVFTSVAAKASDNGTSATLPTPTAPASSFVPLPASRVIDTRVDEPGRLAAGDTLRVDFGDLLPEEATAVALYVASAGAAGTGYLSAGPCGESNSGATVNFDVGAARGAPTITAVGTDGDVCIFASADTEVIVDLQGAFVPGRDSGLSLDPLPTPQRLLDTRDAGRADEVTISAPNGVDAVAVNLAAANASGVGYLSAYPCGDPSTVANVNFQAGPPVSGSAIVNVSDEGTICVFSSASTDVIVDITGTFTVDGELSFVPVPPTRTLDTRDGTGGWSPIHGAGQVLDARVAPPEARAVTGTLTVVRPAATTFIAGFGCVGEPPNASANAGPGTTAANSLTSAISDVGDLCFLASTATTTVFDTTGWWIA